MFECEPSSITHLHLYTVQLLEPERLALVDRFYRDHGYKLRCATHERVFVLSSPAGEWVAAARLIPQVSGHYWLRNLLVAPALRGCGLASRLVREIKPAIFPLGCYCFALPHLTDFYSRLGFKTNPVHCPADIAALHARYRSRGRDWVLMGYQQE